MRNSINKEISEITINWHITEKCNYDCYYCFAKYNKGIKREIHHSKEDIDIILQKVYNFFSIKYKNYSIRLNIAGGEPTLSNNLDYIIEQAYKIGFKVSIITNSSKLTTKFINLNAKYITMFAISLDSLNQKTNRDIGRVSKNKILSLSEITNNLELCKKINKDIKIKINTVINEYNYSEYLGDFIDLLKPYKWKVFQALSFTKIIYCTDKQFNIFLDNHKNIKSKIYHESNEDMRESYIMIDPYGRFYQNSDSDKYKYSKSILNVGIKDAFNSISFDFNKFKKRYN